MIKTNYNPDVLTCLANLSNDEVFTSPQLVNNLLDMLPSEIWKDKNVRFLDPVSKSGVFLREIGSRLMEGLESQIPDKQERINHIFKNQVYGIAITNLTSLLSRRSVYCAKKANSKYSICSVFDDEQGNILYKKNKHVWLNGRCKFCGANKDVYDRDESLETYAYQFIHTTKPEEIFNMKFDVIVGNPPYQLSDGGAQASAMPLYHKFVQQAKKLNPRYLTMIIPSRWFSGGKGLDEFRDEMLNDNRIRIIHDFLNASDCFPGVEIKGGVCFFLWDRDNRGLCKVYTHENQNLVSMLERPLLENSSDIFIRYNEAIPILKKIQSFKEKPFNLQISSRKPFGLATNFVDFKDKEEPNLIKIYANQKIGFVSREKVLKNQDWIDKYKVLVPKAVGSGDSKTDWIKPILADKGSVCTETYIVFGPYDSVSTAENVISYTQTKFFHFLLTLKKITQDATSKVYGFIPEQDFSVSWTDEKLFNKYNLTNDEIRFIHSIILPSETNHE